MHFVKGLANYKIYDPNKHFCFDFPLIYYLVITPKVKETNDVVDKVAQQECSNNKCSLQLLDIYRI